MSEQDLSKQTIFSLQLQPTLQLGLQLMLLPCSLISFLNTRHCLNITSISSQPHSEAGAGMVMFQLNGAIQALRLIRILTIMITMI